MICHNLSKFKLNGRQRLVVPSTSFEFISSKVSYVFSPKNFRNSLRDPRPHFLACSIPRIVTALRHLGILFAPKEPSTVRFYPRSVIGLWENYQQHLQQILSKFGPNLHQRISHLNLYAFFRRFALKDHCPGSSPTCLGLEEVPELILRRHLCRTVPCIGRESICHLSR